MCSGDWVVDSVIRRFSGRVFALSRVEVERSKFVLAIILNFVLWGSGRILLRRDKADIFAISLHIYIYVLFALIWIWWIWFPVIALGGAYFTLDLGRSYQPRKDKESSR